MTPLRRSSRLAPGSGILVLLLLLMLGLSSVLAYQAVAAARSEARFMERALRGYAGLARWELSRRADEALGARLSAAARAGTARVADSADAPRSLAALRSALDASLGWCACPQGLRGVFRVDAGGGAWSVSSQGMQPALRRAVTGLAGSLASGTARDTVRIWPVDAGGARQLVVYHVRAVDGKVRAHGFALDPRRAAPAVLREVLGGPPLLPATLRGGFTNENAMTLVVADAAGGLVFRSPVPPVQPRGRDGAWVDAKVGSLDPQAAPGTVVEGMGGLLAGMTATVSLRPALVAERVSGAPGSRLPLLLAVFGLTLALFGVAVVQLRRQQELVRLRDDFVSGVSHELRTPLAQIRLFADLLETGRLHDPAQRARSVRIINEESRRLTYLVENILHFSRAQRDASRLSPQPVEVGALVREIVDAFAPLARETEFVVRAERGVVARIDQDAFRQVLLNLLDNAARYGPRRQTVQVGMAVVGFSVRVWVQDQGPGVPREDRARIWEPYRRLERDADAATGGSGIGLAVVRDLVGLHGGRAWVEDAPGGGARFVVEVPGATYAGPPGEGEPAAEAVPAGAP